MAERAHEQQSLPDHGSDGGPLRSQQTAGLGSDEALFANPIRMTPSHQEEFPDRQYERFSYLPSQAPVEAELQGPDGRIHAAQVWDISSAGVCLHLENYVSIPENSTGVVHLHQPNGTDVISKEIQVCWTKSTPAMTTVGLVFGGGLLAPGSFLDNYMKVAWINRLERYRRAEGPLIS
jgi:hypothetical protein